MRQLIRSFLFSLLLCSPAFALSNATPDTDDRFPFVVEVRLHGQLICSGTVLYPRIVVTSAHCIQERIALSGRRQVFADHYFSPAELSVVVARNNADEIHDVAEVKVSPNWNSGVINSGANERFVHDVALIITEEPVDVGPPPSLPKLEAVDATVNSSASCALRNNAPAHTTSRDTVLRQMLSQRLQRHGVLVAFGAEYCRGRFCAEAGTRRYQDVTIQESIACFSDNRGRSRLTAAHADFAAALPVSVWCTESSVLPGDSGGALMVAGPMGELYFLGVISAQRGRFVSLASGTMQHRSLATALYPNLDFIESQARRFGYTH